MANSLKTRVISGSFAGLLSFFANFGIQVLQVPLLLSIWSHQTYGLWLAVQSALGLLTALDTGHQNFVSNELMREHQKPTQGVRAVLASALYACLLVGGIELAVFGIVLASGTLPSLLGVKGAAGQSEAALALLMLLALWIGVSNPLGFVGRLFYPLGLYARSVYWGLLLRVMQFLALAATIALGGGIVLASVLTVAFSLLPLYPFLRAIRRAFADAYPWWRGGSVATGLRNFGKSIALTFNNVLEQLTGNGISLLVAQTLGVASIPLFTTLRTVANVATTGSTILLTPLQPDFVRFHVNREFRKLSQTFSISWLFSGCVLYGGMAAALLFIEPLYRAWTHGKLEFSAELFSGLCLAVAYRNFGAPLYQFLFVTNQLKAQNAIALSRGGIGFGLSIALIPQCGLLGVSIALATAEVAASLLLPLWLTRKVFQAEGAELPGRAIALGLGNVLSVTAIFALVAARPDDCRVIVLAGLALILAGSWAQYRCLEREVQDYLYEHFWQPIRRFV